MNPMTTKFVWLMVPMLAIASPAIADEAPPPLHTSGFVEGASAWTNRGLGGPITGNLDLTRSDEFLLNAAEVRVERPVPEKVNGSGFVIEALAGSHAELIHAAGLDLGAHADLVQAYGVWSLPDAGLQVSVGKMATMLGNEVIESVANPNLSVGSQYVFIENFTDLGVDAAWTGPSGWSARLRVANGWDVVTDNNRSKTVFGKLGWTSGPRSLAVLGYTGRELPDSVGGNRSGVEMLAAAPLGKITTTVQLDYGREEALDADWRAGGIWMVLPIRGNLALAIRGDVLDDHRGVRTSGTLGLPFNGGQTLLSGTATLQIRATPGTLIRPEIRYDRSTVAAFEGERDQRIAAVGAAVQF
jgi:hypothetical protein